MHEYFKQEDGTLENEYTNYFKGKNLILFMAESFNEIAVREDVTPTLYQLVNSGFKFNNFYTPTISSTIGGEFQELTGLVAASGFLSSWKSGENAYPFGIATVFQEMGYNTYAYHNHTYTFQSRNKYLASLGFEISGNRLGLGTNLFSDRKTLAEEIGLNKFNKELKLAGLDSKKLSVHKLRHTAATLMYQYGNVDIRALQELLGHQSISTTEIYTHVSNEQVRNAIERNPLNT